VGVVGCGGTGSATAILLARLGVGQLVLFDDDIVDVTNLNRLHGSRRGDADAIRPKVDVVAREIADMAIGTRVVPVRAWVGDPACRDALKSCDVIFGCTDDHDGRLMLNRFSYFYLIPVIDMGLAIDPNPVGGLRDLSGRVTVLVPGAPCLLCRGVVDPALARDEDLERSHPEEYERRKREAYVRGGGDPAPAVVTFTTATACLAVDELLQGLTCFRDPGGWVWHRVRRFDLLLDRRPGAQQNPHCPICVDQGYWGRGDIDPFLDRTN
jgi:molybdopterin/thiamine biosynthesis adenylyltransferase